MPTILFLHPADQLRSGEHLVNKQGHSIAIHFLASRINGILQCEMNQIDRFAIARPMGERHRLHSVTHLSTASGDVEEVDMTDDKISAGVLLPSSSSSRRREGREEISLLFLILICSVINFFSLSMRAGRKDVQWFSITGLCSSLSDT